jgi:3',5'-cyclic AMP phosphodiesterase CpdA
VTPTSVEVFAVEPTAAQLIVRSPTDGPHELAVGDGTWTAEVHDGITAVEVDDLEPYAMYALSLDGQPAGEFRTLPPPPGRYLGRFATVSDLHIGETGFGHVPRFTSDTDYTHAHPVVALRAAVRELAAWGSQGLVVKGDLTHDCRAKEFDLAASILATYPGPLRVMPGNHDGGNHNHDDGVPVLAAHGLELQWATRSAVLGGLNVVMVNTVRRGHEHGYPPSDDDPVFELIRDAPSMVLIHHQLMTTRLPYYVPFGVPKGPARDFLGRLASVNPAVLLSSGHTHRHRRRRYGPIAITEVGSVKDHPGTWAGYLVYEGGVVQVVRRIADSTVLVWTERTRRNAMGAWGRWSPGRLEDRSFSHAWPNGTR